ncbi:HlyD family type I secretion periplasmic adaptor subunit [Bradyrhizobium daqingense]|uniref:Membrane fusion protein (MFP) family protein n=1 Tax=Bradyrhizobium daqingense TaxID=993502 RepID=A0A562LJ93_9BRAD|nr:HlyD family type I secretion periplasmic adaptor subunit [Bradyrhizobium daqingense]TWI07692.1 epimerase transport system membrane fusion protein [Bradyrhizobium daqingense]UFS89986.1 HlyD family type I secretion periplasmic adaptor subunit [Bradyrhizobium daqingense]
MTSPGHDRNIVISRHVVTGDRWATTSEPSSDMRRIVAWGCVLLVLQFCCIGVWATTVPLRSAVVASGFTKVHSKRKAVQHLEGGIIKSILVRENDRVQAGQVIARLDTTQIEAMLGSFEAKLFADLAMEARLAAERAGEKEIQFPAELRTSSAAAAGIAVLTQRAEFAARSTAIDGERKQIDQQMLQSEETIRGLEGDTKGAEQQLALLNEEIADTSSLLAKGLARKPRLLALQRSQAETKGQIARNAASISQARTKIAELDDRRRQLELDQQRDIAKQLHATSSEVGELRHRIAALRDQLVRSELRAPESGKVVGLNSRGLSAVLAPRETLLEIVPLEDRLVIEATLKPTDRQEVYAGQTARVRVLALNIRRIPMLEAKIVAVAADALNDPKTGVASYMAELELGTTTQTAYYLSSLLPGMPVEVFVETGERTFAEYLLQPMVLRIHRAFRES